MSYDNDVSTRIGIAIGRFIVGAGIGAAGVGLVWAVPIWLVASVSVPWLVWPWLGVSLVCGLLGLVVGDAFIDAGRALVARLFGLVRWW